MLIKINCAEVCLVETLFLWGVPLQQEAALSVGGGRQQCVLLQAQDGSFIPVHTPGQSVLSLLQPLAIRVFLLFIFV